MKIEFENLCNEEGWCFGIGIATDKFDSSNYCSILFLWFSIHINKGD